MKLNQHATTDQKENIPNFAHACLASCRKVLAQLNGIKSGILAEFRPRLEGHEHLLDLAVNEAEALAWQTEFPQLFFPTLATEKARAVATWHAHQQALECAWSSGSGFELRLNRRAEVGRSMGLSAHTLRIAG